MFTVKKHQVTKKTYQICFQKIFIVPHILVENFSRLFNIKLWPPHRITTAVLQVKGCEIKQVLRAKNRKNSKKFTVMMV